MDKDTSQPLGHPWLNEKPGRPKETNGAPEIAPEISEEIPQEQDVFDMATDLMSAIRSDRMHRLKQAKQNR